MLNIFCQAGPSLPTNQSSHALRPTLEWLEGLWAALDKCNRPTTSYNSRISPYPSKWYKLFRSAAYFNLPQLSPPPECCFQSPSRPAQWGRWGQCARPRPRWTCSDTCHKIPKISLLMTNWLPRIAHRCKTDKNNDLNKELNLSRINLKINSIMHFEETHLTVPKDKMYSNINYDFMQRHNLNLYLIHA